MSQSIVRPISTTRHPITSILLPVPIVCFAGALLTDLSYVNSSGNLLWVNFSSWLITAGLLFGGFSLLALFVEGLRRRIRPRDAAVGTNEHRGSGFGACLSHASGK